MEFGEMKQNTSKWSNFCMLSRRAGLSASAGLPCYLTIILYVSNDMCINYRHCSCMCSKFVVQSDLRMSLFGQCMIMPMSQTQAWCVPFGNFYFWW